ncbi:hypothetical protein F5984_01045 [Rudanella paleaurantiibacter]|uniref:Uncharacterized protein n=1 Tax=Rudanella paleaurantiibacter TaxID=2614655 RepID=A0A7J5U402_9BACT|nr:hypothetical protein [Rudanella paleaurantiibacter]KAB7732574.1 hypothetical protein F5984_01045 [Rudanella paleaurantiibacter]
MSPDSIIAHIAALQSHTDSRFSPGLFPSYRIQPQWLNYRRADNNVFLTACTLFTLQGIRHRLAPDAARLVDEIGERAARAYPHFRNKDGLDTYNFWPTRPSRHFSNGRLLHRFDHFRIPDDIDDTALVFLTQPPAPETLIWLKEKLSQHANGTRHRIRNTFPEYRHLRAYSTWFGKKMPIDFDVCALSNLLYLIFRHKLPRNEHDTDSLTLLVQMVRSGQYVSQPFRCAPHYARTPLILYHIGRLLAMFHPPELVAVQPQLVADARAQLAQVTHPMDRVILSTTLRRLGENPPPLDLTHIEQSFETFHFFIAGMLTAYEHPLLNRLATSPFVHMRWVCEAHCWALVAEYLTEGGGEERRRG